MLAETKPLAETRPWGSGLRGRRHGCFLDGNLHGQQASAAAIPPRQFLEHALVFLATSARPLFTATSQSGDSPALAAAQPASLRLFLDGSDSSTVRDRKTADRHRRLYRPDSKASASSTATAWLPRFDRESLTTSRRPPAQFDCRRIMGMRRRHPTRENCFRRQSGLHSPDLRGLSASYVS